MTGPVLTTPRAKILQIMRNVTGRVDRNDPAFTDEIMTDYLNAFIQQEHPQEVQIFQNQTWWDFTIDENSPNPFPVDLDNLGFATIGPLAYVGYLDLPNNNSFRMFWYTDPGDFFYRWPPGTAFTPQQPTYVLYYNNELIFRGPPDQAYSIKISAYKIDYSFEGGTLVNGGSTVSGTGSGPDSEALRGYLTRYFAYGASLDIFSDYSEMDKYNQVFQVYRRYRAQVLARTWNQLSSQRTGPDF